jgi:cytochrome P450
MDLVEAFAFSLPITVIGELLGIPIADRNKFRRWSDAFVTPDLSEGGEERFVQSMGEFIAYFQKLFAARRNDPRQDLITGLLRAEEAGDRLSEQELFSMVILLIVAGHETTTSLIGNGMLALLQHPEQLERLKNDPSGISAAVEELVRYDGPAERAITRFVAVDTELGGQWLRRGDFVIAIIGAADRDPQQFSEASKLIIERAPNRHLGFGKGAHYCLGAPLARLEAEIAFTTLLRRLPDLRLAVSSENLVWRLPPVIRGLQSLLVQWG